MSTYIAHKSDEDARPQLFCFPPSGAGASYYSAWHRAARQQQYDVVPVQLPGRESRLAEPPARSMDVVVDDVLRLVGAQVRPFVLFGHSMGGAVAFETAAAMPSDLTALCRGVVISGCSAPGLGLLKGTKSQASDPDLVATLRRLGGTPESLLANASFMAMFTKILRADFEVCESVDVAPDRVIQHALVAIGAQDDADVPEAHLRAWSRYTTGPFSMHMVPDGGHHFVRVDAHRAMIFGLVASLFETAC